MKKNASEVFATQEVNWVAIPLSVLTGRIVKVNPLVATVYLHAVLVYECFVCARSNRIARNDRGISITVRLNPRLVQAVRGDLNLDAPRMVRSRGGKGVRYAFLSLPSCP